MVTIDDYVQPTDDWRFGPDFFNRVARGVTVQAVDSVTVEDSAGLDVTSTILVGGSEQVDANPTSCSARFHGFVDGETYIATFVATLSTGEKRTGKIKMPCRA